MTAKAEGQLDVVELVRNTLSQHGQTERDYLWQLLDAISRPKESKDWHSISVSDYLPGIHEIPVQVDFVFDSEGGLAEVRVSRA